MGETNNLLEHFENKAAYDKAHGLAGNYQRAYDLRRHARVDANSKAIAEAAAKLSEIGNLLKKYRGEEKAALTKAAGVREEHLPALMLQALEDYRQHLLDQGEQTKAEAERVQSQIAVLQHDAAVLEKVVATPDLLSQIRNFEAPEAIASQCKPGDLPNIKELYLKIYTQRLADFEGVAPAGGFTQKELDGFWQQALEDFQAANKKEPAHLYPRSVFDDPHPATRPIRGDVGWTGRLKHRRVGGRSISY